MVRKTHRGADGRRPPAPPAGAAQLEVEAHAETDSTDILGRRIGALLIDAVLLAVVFVVYGVATGHGHSGGGQARVNFGSGASMVLIVLALVYFFCCEAASGQTLGKRMLGIRVTSLDGGRASAGQILARTVLRLVDSLPIAYVVGIASIIITGRNRHQRLGDLAAKTIVRRVGINRGGGT